MFKIGLWKSLIDFTNIQTYPTLPCPYCNSIALKIDECSFQSRDASGFKWDALRSPSEKKMTSQLLGGTDGEKLLGFVCAVAATLDLTNYTPSKFVTFFHCDDCHKDVSALGTAKIPNFRSPKNVKESIKVECFNPPIPMFPLQETTPINVNNELMQAFSHFHSDLTASGGKIRRAIEQLCNELGYKEKTLHKSIEKMQEDYPIEATWLYSLKLVGNEATHADGIEEEDLLHAIEIFEGILDIFRRRHLVAKTNQTVLKIDSKFKK